MTDRQLFPGETAVAGSTVITVMDTSSLLAKVHLAQPALRSEGGTQGGDHCAGHGCSGGGNRIAHQPALDPGSTTVEVWLKLPNRQGLLKVGDTGACGDPGCDDQGGDAGPRIGDRASTDGGTSVMVIAADGTAHKKAVTVGIRTPEMVQILSGLDADDMVITTGGYGLDNGTKVNGRQA